MSLTLTLARGGGEVSGSGTNIELDGTIAGGAIESVEMYGDTQQTTYSGKNLANPEPLGYADMGITATYNAQTGDITLSGTATAMYSIPFRRVDQTIPAGTYTIKQYGELSHGRMGINFRRADGTQITEYVVNTGTLVNTFTLSEPAAKTYLFTLYHSAGQTVEGTVKFQLESGNQATSFEPYVGGTASPNPDYPQEVQTVTGRQVVTITDGGSQSQEYEINLGKNLFDKDNFPSVDGFIRADNYTLTSSASNKTTYIKADPNTTYTFSGFVPGVALVVGTFNKVPALGDVANARVLKGASDTTVTITTGASDSYIAFMYKTSSDELDTSAFQIEKGSTATTYAPYFTPIELCKIGTYQDYIYKSGEDWYLHKEVVKISPDGTETWNSLSISNPDYIYCYTSAFDSLVKPKVWNGLFSDKFIVYDYSEGGYEWISPSARIKGACFSNGDNSGTINLRVICPKTTADSVGNFKTWLGNSRPVFYYPIKTPTDTQITNSALIAQLNALNAGTTYDGTTIITVSSENLAGPLDVTVSSNVTKTYTEVEIGSPFTIADVEGKSSNTTLDGNVYVDWAYNKKQYSFDLFNLTPQDYADIRTFYDYQFNNSAFPTITVPELNIDKLPVYMEISSRNIINQCLLTDKLTIKFRETVQP